jgi:hypothetical protein
LAFGHNWGTNSTDATKCDLFERFTSVWMLHICHTCLNASHRFERFTSVTFVWTLHICAVGCFVMQVWKEWKGCSSLFPSAVERLSQVSQVKEVCQHKSGCHE